jgi:hypothetical protein
LWSFLTFSSHIDVRAGRRSRVPLAVWGVAVDNPVVLRRYLYRRDDGTLRRGRLVVLLATTIVLAMFGTALVVLAPQVADSTFGRGVWVMFAVVLLKFPLIALLWSLIRRNAEWPGRPVKWSDQELGAILQRLMDEAQAAAEGPNGQARLAHLSREAWHVADNVSGESKVDALSVALSIDELLMGRHSNEPAA